MRKSRFSEPQIVGVLEELKAGAKAAALCRKYGVSEATFYNWRAKYSGLETSDLIRLKQQPCRPYAIGSGQGAAGAAPDRAPFRRDDEGHHAHQTAQVKAGVCW